MGGSHIHVGQSNLLGSQIKGALKLRGARNLRGAIKFHGAVKFTHLGVDLVADPLHDVLQHGLDDLFVAHFDLCASNCSPQFGTYSSPSASVM